MPRTVHTDTELETRFGTWWTEAMDFREETTQEEMVTQANTELEERGFTERVKTAFVGYEEVSWELV
jgi:hypothetical protein